MFNYNSQSISKVVIFLFLLVIAMNSCLTKSKFSVNDFKKIEDYSAFNSTYINHNGLGRLLHLRDGEKSANDETDLIAVEYNGGDSIYFRFWTENGLIANAHKVKRVGNSMEVMFERKRLYIPMVFFNVMDRIRIGQDRSDSLQIDVKDESFGWLLVMAGGHDLDYRRRFASLENDSSHILIPVNEDGRWGLPK